MADRRFTGSHPENGPDFPVTMWLDDRTQHIDGSQWRLRINGHVDYPYEMDLEELQSWNSRLTATLDCTGGWYTTRDWQGVPVKELLARASVKPGAGSITIRSRTGYYRRYSMGEARPRHAGQPRGWYPALARPRLPSPHGGAPQAGLRLGEVGGRDNRQRHQ